jgi:hypothetical protein
MFCRIHMENKVMIVIKLNLQYDRMGKTISCYCTFKIYAHCTVHVSKKSYKLGTF